VATTGAGGPQRVRRTTDDRVICERLETADTALERMRGLIGRDGLPPGEGLLIETNSIHMLFMRFPIDALFLSAPAGDGTRRVVAVRPELPAWRGVVWYVRSAKVVVELPAGTLAEHGVRPGDTVVLEDRDAQLGAASSEQEARAA
jgi:uncharacterized membrane protein (UPF0127 family)